MKKSKNILVLLVLLGAASLAEAQIMVSSTTASTIRIYEKSGREKGVVLRPEASFGLGLVGREGLLNHLNGSLNYQFNPYFSLGIGSGVNLFAFNLNNPLVAIPLYANVRAYFCDRKWSPFFDLKLGFNYGLNEIMYEEWHYTKIYSLKGLLMDGTFGMQYKKFDFGASAGIFMLGESGLQMSVKTYVAYNIPLKKKVNTSITTTTENKKEKVDSGHESYFLIRPEGAVGILYGSLLLNLNSTVEYQINPYYSVGVGTGFDYFPKPSWTGEYLAGLPLYANARVYFIDNEWKPFFNLKIGYHFGLNTSGSLWSTVEHFSLQGIIVSGTLGIQYENFDFGVSGGIYSIHQYNSLYKNALMSFYTVNVAYNIPFKKK